eukprot:TRINITY_DN62733_c0_g1_i1.p1 TRINITY_DN62733_c0_g1~~TRINITY_DN62733_c0_g1_i1.p1  ORF type:complete len:496 (-),score=52.08 TRINITY_DN62733_c0_g1_i1:24-1511(-)
MRCAMRTLLLSVPLLIFTIGSSASETSGSLPRRLVEELQSLLSDKSDLLLPGDASFLGASRQKNARFDARRPLAVVYCSSVADVQVTLNISRAYGVSVSLRSGGHSFGGYAVMPNALVLDTSRLQDMQLEEMTDVVSAGPGITNRQLFEYLVPRGRRLPNGGCPDVRLGGYVLGGGWGTDMRQLGLVIDHLLSVTLVLANGSLVTASMDHHPDLFWALRGGGGGNFGVSVQYTLRTDPIPAHRVTRLSAGWRNVCDSRKETTDLWSSLQAVLTDDSGQWWPFEFGLSIGSDRTLLLNGLWHGDPIAGQAQLSRWLTSLPRQPDSQSFSDHSFEDVAGYRKNNFTNFPANFWHSGLIRKALPAAFFERWCSHANQPLVSIGFEGLGGVVNTVDASATAYPHRSAIAEVIVMGFYTRPSDEAAAKHAASVVYAELQPFTHGVYVNNIDDSLMHWEELYYGANLGRLKIEKAAVNPDDAFKFPQSISLPTTAFEALTM